jgi:Pro-kumamolisin, activation domain/FG-GAP-like repeat/Bacterial Ig-like domain (group 3)
MYPISFRSRFYVFIAFVFLSLLNVIQAQGQIAKSPAESTPAKSYAAKRYAENDLGLESGERVLHQMKLILKPSAETESALTKFLEEQRESTNPNFHKWLTPDQFAQRFGATAALIEKATAWLKKNGMSNIEVSRGDRFITFSGQVSSVSSGFKTEIHIYKVNGVRHFANSVEPAIPGELADAVSGIVGLNDFSPKPEFLWSYTAANYMGPDDLATMYDIHPLYAQGIDGTGVTIAVPGAATVNLTDYQYYRSFFGLSPNYYQIVAVPGQQDGLAPADSDDGYEATLDLEMVGGIARNATILYIQSASEVAGIQYAIDNQLAQILSTSMGECETAVSADHIYYQALAQQANAEGITWTSSSGDKGPANCDWSPEIQATQGIALLLPASVPEITAVGGTEIIYTDASGAPYWSTSNNANEGNLLSYVPETVWNGTENGEPSTGNMLASGGGPSAYFPIPGFQAGLGNPSIVNRMVPDVSLNASSSQDAAPNMFYYLGAFAPIGGTSASTPMFAGMLALVEHYLMAHGSITAPGLGNVNPSLYNIDSNVPSAFHDITTGDNDVNCVIGTPDCTIGRMGYPATVGYDMATGLGSVDLYNLASNWALYQSSSSTTTLNVNTSARTAGQNVTFTTKTTSSSGNPQNGVITLTYNNPTNQLYGSIEDGYELPGPFPATGTADSTGTATITTNLLPAGTNTVTANFGGTANVNSSVSNSVTVNVTGFPTTTTVVPASNSAPAGETVNLAITVVGPTGQSPIGPLSQPGNVGYIDFGPVSGSFYSTTQSPESGTLTLTTPPLPMGPTTFIVSFSGTAFAAASQSPTFVITGTNQAATITTLTASSSRLVVGSPVMLTAHIAEYGTNTALTGTVSFLSNGISLGSSTLDATGKASLISSSLPVGSDSITATYSGNVVGSSSSPVTVVVTTVLPTTTTTSLTASASSIASGTAVTLTATVAEVGTSTLPSGTVKFCDATAVFCTDIHLLGTAQVTSAGTATLLFIPGIGSHMYKAVFMGDTGVEGSTSGTVPLIVSGTYTTTTQIAQSGSVGNYTLTATVDGTGPVAPTGTVSFLDASNGNAVLGTAALNAPGITFVNSSSPATGNGPIALAVGDFNGDGIPDLAVANNFDNTVTVCLGDGKGNFAATATSPLTGFNSPFAIVAGDFNGDGNLDLAVVNGGNDTLSVLLGDGKGNFTAIAASPSAGIDPTSIVVGDFNRDGNLDLAVSNNSANGGSVLVLLGDGTGDFAPAASTSPAGGSPQSIAVGDFNGDGIPDLAVADASSGTVSVLLGNGDGTFTAAASPATGVVPQFVAVGDFNGDGIPDLAVVSGEDYVNVLLGNGDGTFTPAGSPAVNFGSYSIAIGDFNGDGIPDLVVANHGSTSVSDTMTVLFGNGDGTFKTASANPVAVNISTSIAAADFDGDGIPDLAIVNEGSDSIAVLLTESLPATATATNISPIGTGTQLVEASYPGDSKDAASTSSTIGLAAELLTPTVTVTPGSFDITTAQALTVTVTVNGGSGSPTPTGSATLAGGGYSSLATTLGSGSATITIPANSLIAGTDTLTVTYTPDAASSSIYNSAPGITSITVTTPVPPSFTVSGTAVTIPPGATAANTSTITLTPAGGFTGSVALTSTITSSPTGAQYPPTLSFGTTSPVSITTTTAGTATLTITTTAATSGTLFYPKRPGARWYAAGGAALACFLLFGIPARRRSWRTILGMLIFFVALTAGVVACGSGGNGGGGNGGGGEGGGGGGIAGTTAGVYTITVTGTSSSTTETGSVTLTVQ